MSSDKRKSFAGSHFFYEDVSGRSVKEDIHELVEITDRYFVLKNVPKNPGTVEFSSFKVWIDRNTYMPMKAEYLDKRGKKYRIVEAVEVKVIQGYQFMGPASEGTSGKGSGILKLATTTPGTTEPAMTLS